MREWEIVWYARFYADIRSPALTGVDNRVVTVGRHKQHLIGVVGKARQRAYQYYVSLWLHLIEYNFYILSFSNVRVGILLSY